MNKIRILPEEVANQIAAGEVVERPASVVKELVENALDAGAKNIKVEIQAGGRALIRVTDDGCGMSRDDALLAFERHATSKINTIHDLERIVSFGFRGEALPSIASVSQLTLITRETDPNTVEGTRIVIHGGKILTVAAAGAPPGTTVEVRNLFYNVPARRKFLKSEETEAAHIHHYIVTAALAFPEVGFTFVKDGRVILQLPPIPTNKILNNKLDGLAERIRIVLPDIPLLPVDSNEVVYELPRDFRPTKFSSEIRLWGFISVPGVTRATRQDQYFYVNRRPVENRTLSNALEEGYQTLIMKGRRPVCCLFVEIDPAEVDVNVHPTKREIKFRHELYVRAFVAEVIRLTLRQKHTTTGAKTTFTLAPKDQQHGQTVASSSQVPRTDLEPKTSTEHKDQPIQTGESPENSINIAGKSPNLVLTPTTAPSSTEYTVDEKNQPLQKERSTAQLPLIAHAATPGASSLIVARPSTEPPSSLPKPIALVHVPLRYLGVLGKIYVLFESDRGLVLMDQHAAHERVLFERMFSYLNQNSTVPSQKLLLPQTIEFSPKDAQLVRELIPTLQALGIGLSEFGPQTFLLDGMPAFLKISDPRQFILDTIDAVKEQVATLSLKHLGRETVAKTVCKHAVKAHDPLSEDELQALLDQLRQCEMPYTCPHGRPTLIELSFRELEKRFGRIV